MAEARGQRRATRRAPAPADLPAGTGAGSGSTSRRRGASRRSGVVDAGSSGQARGQGRKTRAANVATWDLAGRPVRVTSLDRVYWPDDGITKGEVLAYYREMAAVMLPHFAGRPVTLKLYPRGIRGPSYYRRDQTEDAPDWLRSVDYRPESTGEVIQLPLIDDAAGLIWYANKGGIEFHLWTSKLPDLAEPDQVVFDLDPGDEAEFGAVLRTTLRLREELERQGLRAYAKLTGGTGLHVHLPLAPGHTFDGVRAWAKAVAERLAAAHPELIDVMRGATHRGRLVTVDYPQNSVGRNTAAAYTLRARPGAPVAAPVTWEEIEAGDLRPGDLTLRSMPERVRRLGDLFAPVLEGGQRLPEVTENG